MANFETGKPSFVEVLSPNSKVESRALKHFIKQNIISPYRQANPTNDITLLPSQHAGFTFNYE